MDDQKLSRVQVANILSTAIANLDKPAPAARVAPQSAYGRALGEPAPKPVRIPLIARLMA